MKDFLKKMQKTYISLFLLWSMFSLSLDGFSFFFGSISCGGVMLIMRRIGKITQTSYPFLLNKACFMYFPWLFKEMCKEASKVLRIILFASVKDVSIIQIFPHQCLTPEALTLYAHSITFTPGTVTIACDEENIHIHSLAKEGITHDAQQILGSKLAFVYKT